MAGHYFQPVFLSEAPLFWSEKIEMREDIAIATSTSIEGFAARNTVSSDAYGGWK